jgi:hypothetical protein
MLTIRRDQADRLSSFVDHIAAHVQEYFPDRYRSLGLPAVRTLITQTLKKALEYGFVNDGHLCQLVDLAVVFGPGFDSDPGTPWAARILTDESLSPALRMKRLGEAAMEALGAGSQPQAEP